MSSTALMIVAILLFISLLAIAVVVGIVVIIKKRQLNDVNKVEENIDLKKRRVENSETETEDLKKK